MVCLWNGMGEPYVRKLAGEQIRYATGLIFFRGMFMRNSILIYVMKTKRLYDQFKSLLQPKAVPLFLPTSCSDLHCSKKLWLAILWILCKHKQSEGERGLRMEGGIQGRRDLSLLAEVLSYSH